MANFKCSTLHWQPFPQQQVPKPGNFSRLQKPVSRMDLHQLDQLRKSFSTSRRKLQTSVQVCVHKSHVGNSKCSWQALTFLHLGLYHLADVFILDAKHLPGCCSQVLLLSQRCHSRSANSCLQLSPSTFRLVPPYASRNIPEPQLRAAASPSHATIYRSGQKKKNK